LPEAAAIDGRAPRWRLQAEDGRLLLDVARQAIEHALRTGRPPLVDAARHPEALRAPTATFVTLRQRPEGSLRGCIGELEPRLPLIESVVWNAFRAAFHDPRFAPLDASELDALDIHCSVLGPLEALAVSDEAELLAALRPGVDGLVLEDGVHRATFLPAVWTSLPAPADFVHELQRKAGLPPGAWPADMRAWRYEVDEIG
jgi:AmmeMemoRadiSam system protein A